MSTSTPTPRNAFIEVSRQIMECPEALPLDVDNPKAACGAAKAPMDCMSPLSIIECNAVMGGGSWKYGYMNFRESKVDARTYASALNRHFNKWLDGRDFDKESRQHELAHVMACCSILIDAFHTGQLIDNRPKTGLVEQLLQTAEDNTKLFRAENKSWEERRDEINKS